jgi:KaiC domain protein
MKQKGWDITPFLNKALFVIKLDPTDFNVANNRIKNELPKLIEEVKASRVVIDPISLFEDLFDTDSERRQEMYRFIEGLRDRNCTIMMTSETHRDNVFSSRHGLIEYLSDTVILLRYVRPSDLTDVHLALEVVKMRMSAHSREIKPYEIEQDQVMVYSEANVF